MPAEGFSTITVTVDVHKKLKAFADKTHRSIPKAVEYLVDQARKEGA
jgi:hypothetical protein